jgi:hypothetical protein
MLMTNKQLAQANFALDHCQADGYLKRCVSCGQPIYMKQDYDGRWRPYESWAAGNAEEGEWLLHECEPDT